MKRWILPQLLFVASALILETKAEPSLQERLIQAELDLSAASVRGLGEGHPQTIALRSELEALSQHPGIRNQEYWDTLSERQESLKAELAELKASGMGPAHPEVQALEVKLGTIDAVTKSAARGSR